MGFNGYCRIAALLVIVAVLAAAAPVPAGDGKTPSKDSKSAFGPAFDEIVVESSLTVRRKPSERQSRDQKTNTTAPITIKTKRDTSNKRPARQNGFNKGFGGSAADSQAQSFNSFGPLGNFGASATGAQTQSFAAGPGGPSGSAGFSGTQQYSFNGQTIDIAFGNAFSGAGKGGANGGAAAITVTGPDGKKRPFNG